jgi:hypothetical protein
MVNGACLLLLAWLYGGDLLDAVRAQSNELGALAQLPSVPFAAIMLALALVGGALTVRGVLQRRGGDWRGYRVMPIVAVVGLFVDLFLISANKTPFSSAARAAAAVETFEQKANALATSSAVSSDSATLEKALEDLGDAPWLLNGRPLGRWTLKVVGDCAGPKLDRGDAAPGTMVYCVSVDRTQAWITAVGLPAGERFGSAQMVTSGGQPLVGLVQLRTLPQSPPADRLDGPDAPQPRLEAPMYFDADAGNL